MPGTTANLGWPKPLSGDPIAQGADTLGQALDKIDAQFYLPPDKFNGNEPMTSYPIGVSIMRVSQGDITVTGWPSSSSAASAVVTLRAVSYAWQLFMCGAQLWYRYLGSTAGGTPTIWSALSGAGVPIAMVGGILTAPFAGAAANTLVSVAVTYPAGRFASVPRNYLQLVSATPQQYFVSASGASTSGFTFYGYTNAAVTTGPNVNWWAVSGGTT